jgi:predicted FMN-binding regulatory protein PaiB
MSQNRDAEDRAGVVRGLRADGDARSLAVAEQVDRPAAERGPGAP